MLLFSSFLGPFLEVILAASSPFFQKLLGRNKHPHPLIYMRGMKSDDLLAIVDFLYRGEANVFQENLDSFLTIAEELQLKGLMGKMDEKVADFEEDASRFSPANTKIPTEAIKRKSCKRIVQDYNLGGNGALAIPSNFSGDFEELEERVKSMMGKSENKNARGNQFAYVCKECGKERDGTNIKNHIEANHLEGLVIPCNLCDKTFRSRNYLKQHIRQHKN